VLSSCKPCDLSRASINLAIISSTNKNWIWLLAITSMLYTLEDQIQENQLIVEKYSGSVSI
jgi:hypothetical protein